MNIIAIDLGSVRCGVVIGPAEGSPRVDLADVVEPVADANDRPLPAAVDALAAHVCGCSRCVLEIAPLYIRPAATPQEARAVALAHATCERLADAIADRCASMVPPVPVVRVSRATWAHRLIPHHSGGIPQPAARAAVLRHLEGSGSVALQGDDRIDAAGAYLWSVLPALARASKIRRRGKRGAPLIGPKLPKGMRRKLRVLARTKARSDATRAARDAAGCACKGAKHRRGCPMAPPPRLRGYTPEAVERARAALAGFLPRRAMG